MSFLVTARCGVAPQAEKRFHRLPAADFYRDDMEMDMELRNEPRTLVHVNENSQIVVAQPDEECCNCGRDEVAFVYFSADRARKVAHEILSLADELEAGGE